MISASVLTVSRISAALDCGNVSDAWYDEEGDLLIVLRHDNEFYVSGQDIANLAALCFVSIQDVSIENFQDDELMIVVFNPQIPGDDTFDGDEFDEFDDCGTDCGPHVSVCEEE